MESILELIYLEKRSFTDKRKEEAYAINLDEYLYIGFDCIK